MFFVEFERSFLSGSGRGKFEFILVGRTLGNMVEDAFFSRRLLVFFNPFEQRSYRLANIVAAAVTVELLYSVRDLIHV